MLRGERLTFDEESRALYDAVAPRHTEAEFQAVLRELDKRLPGGGPLLARYEAFRETVRDPEGPLDACSRRRSRVPRAHARAHRAAGRRELHGRVRDGRPGAATTGIRATTAASSRSTRICRSTSTARSIWRATKAIRATTSTTCCSRRTSCATAAGMEFTVYPLFSPQSLIAEGTANYGIEVAFPGRRARAFERDVLFPPPGSTASRVEEYYEVLELVEQLAYAGNEAARRYLNGQIDARGRREWHETYALMPPRARRSSACGSSISTAPTSSTTTSARTSSRATSSGARAPTRAALERVRRAALVAAVAVRARGVSVLARSLAAVVADRHWHRRRRAVAADRKHSASRRPLPRPALSRDDRGAARNAPQRRQQRARRHEHDRQRAVQRAAALAAGRRAVAAARQRDSFLVGFVRARARARHTDGGPRLDVDVRVVCARALRARRRHRRGRRRRDRSASRARSRPCRSRTRWSGASPTSCCIRAA